MSVTSARWLCMSAAIVLSACSGSKPPSGDTSSNSASGSHDASAMAMPSTGDPDTDFLRGMIPHHQGAIAMAREELAKGTDPRVRKMAEGVIAAQQAEIEQMQTWLAERQAAKKGNR